jgi:hypothetical protein
MTRKELLESPEYVHEIIENMLHGANTENTSIRVANWIIGYREEYASIKLSEYKTQMREEIVKELEEKVKLPENSMIDFEVGYRVAISESISIVKEVMK